MVLTFQIILDICDNFSKECKLYGLYQQRSDKDFSISWNMFDNGPFNG